MKEHLTFRKAVDYIIEKKSDEICTCDSCSKMMTRASEVLSSFRKRAFSEPELSTQNDDFTIAMNKKNNIPSTKRSKYSFFIIGTLSAACLAVAILVFLNINKSTQSLAQKELKGTVIFIAGETRINGKAAVMRDSVSQGDVIATQAKSAITVQFANAALVAVREKSSLTVSHLSVNNIPSITIDLKDGFIFNKIKKGEADYMIRSSSAIAAVRGTSFTYEISPHGTVIKLLRGNVAINKAGDETQRIILDQGKAAAINENTIIQTYAFTDEDTKKLETLDKIQFIDNTKENRSTNQIIPEDSSGILTGQLQKEQQNKLTLSDLEKKFGALSKIKIKNGKEYVGSFMQKGSMMEITTIDGKTKIPSTEVESIVPYKL